MCRPVPFWLPLFLQCVPLKVSRAQCEQPRPPQNCRCLVWTVCEGSIIIQSQIVADALSPPQTPCTVCPRSVGSITNTNVVSAVPVYCYDCVTCMECLQFNLRDLATIKYCILSLWWKQFISQLLQFKPIHLLVSLYSC